jgi:hypothetical protein
MLPDDDVRRLRRLLALKHHESPPPGYFLGFADKIIARIEAEQVNPGVSWWRALLGSITERPSLAGLFGLCAGVVLLGGINAARSMQPDGSDADLGLSPSSLAMQAAAVDWPAAPSLSLASALVDFESSSTAPVLHRSSLAHTAFRSAEIRPASFTPALRAVDLP